MNPVLEDKGLRDEGLLLRTAEQGFQIGGGERLELAFVVLADVPGRHRLTFPAADLHDHLERHALLLEPLRGVAARTVLDEVANPGLREVPAEELIALRPGF